MKIRIVKPSETKQYKLNQLSNEREKVTQEIKNAERMLNYADDATTVDNACYYSLIAENNLSSIISKGKRCSDE